MPKQKTHSGAKKRFKLTGSGSVSRARAGMRHNFEHRSSRVTRRLTGRQFVSDADSKLARKLLGK
ncbi:50S ribosomal protein L35 [Tropheryma whipplei]|uniref:50S ribosomal protein L35 n=1 Tax=Tropheryma whipplei TaxID=2039 RepID=UPI0001608959|nr:50S ribosomal protein L35 [Tropheryma whipplei]MCO8182929.1 50S ribosomal protein L35 [Tropheryma whipplei]MCO8190516.1 50S ribosomal protein L35 [Tropheryma whipplei]